MAHTLEFLWAEYEYNTESIIIPLIKERKRLENTFETAHILRENDKLQGK